MICPRFDLQPTYGSDEVHSRDHAHPRALGVGGLQAIHLQRVHRNQQALEAREHQQAGLRVVEDLGGDDPAAAEGKQVGLARIERRQVGLGRRDRDARFGRREGEG